jgi:NADH-quinone oxidoreductase subunit M
MILETLSLSSLLIIPALGALVCLGPWFTDTRDPSGRLCKGWAVFISAVTALLLVAISAATMSGADGFLYVEEYRAWVPSLGLSFHLTLDGLSLGFCILTCFVSLAVVCWSYAPKKQRAAWYAMLLLAQCTVLGAFLATDLVIFYVFYELMLLPVLAGIALWGGPERKQAVFRFLMYTVSGSVLMLVAIVYLGWQSAQILQPHSGIIDFAFTISTLTSLPTMNYQAQLALCIAFLFAFGIKIPIVPFHGWLVETYRQAPPGLVAFIAALLGKVGVYGIVRFVIPLFPDAMATLEPTIVVLGAIAIVGGALMAWVQRDLRVMLAYSSLSHLGFCVLGIGVASTISISGAVFQAISHGLVTGGLFLIYGRLSQIVGSDALDDFGGLAERYPRLAFFSMAFTVAAVALPLTSGFVGEFLVMLAAWERYPVWMLVSSLGIVLGAVYMLRAYRFVMFGAGPRLAVAESRDLSGMDGMVLSLLAVAVFLLGIVPGPLLEGVQSSPSMGVRDFTARDGRARIGNVHDSLDKELLLEEQEGSSSAGFEVASQVYWREGFGNQKKG